LVSQLLKICIFFNLVIWISVRKDMQNLRVVS
jgi:hypothetical protein